MTSKIIQEAELDTTETGRAAYEADVRKRPTYHDGSPRRTWEQLGDVERWSWTRPIKPASTCLITEYGLTQRLSFQINVF